jgi:hypothetical protein
VCLHARETKCAVPTVRHLPDVHQMIVLVARKAEVVKEFHSTLRKTLIVENLISTLSHVNPTCYLFRVIRLLNHIYSLAMVQFLLELGQI